ncbi:MAG: cytidine deaminase [Caldilineaceae bacterium]|nr:cytidine deaminase [Caldilineaceae bacterium]MCY4092862.1 cytidine deaminase [Caldilineaceae bacterium]MCY4119091.1 cytidine deaminase [Caldilineaceae bacterium]MDE0181798.1 cytidine deaminase [Caldilineaceae bacterium]
MNTGEISSQQLIAVARSARQQAYAPYSSYHVGAAVLTLGGDIIAGCNVENASYGGTICAERVALTAAVAQGKRQFSAIAVVTEDGASPCGLCRQVMYELGPQMDVFIADGDGNVRTTTVKALLPEAFAGP